MFKRLKYLTLSLFIMLSANFALVPLEAGAASFKGDACAAVNVLNDSTSTTCASNGESALSRILKLVLNVLSLIAGIAAIIMIIIGGFKFITSNGDSNNIASARNSILYAIIGLVVVASSQLMIHFVLSGVNATSTVCATTKSTKNCTVQLCTKPGQKACTVKK